jgi:hypothetical protein
VFLKHVRPLAWLTHHDVVGERELIEDREAAAVAVNPSTVA